MDNYYITSELTKLLQLFLSNNVKPKKETIQYKLQQIESNIDETDTSLRRKLVQVYNHYLFNYARGGERIVIMTTIVNHLKLIINIDKNDHASMIELTRILIEEKTVRDLELALHYTEILERNNKKPSWLTTSIFKAKRWQGDIEIPKDTNFSETDITPASLREERVKLRKLMTTLSKDSHPKTHIVAKRLYNLGLYVTFLYGNHDCNSGVSGLEFDKANKIFKNIASKFNYDYLGRIENCSFLSNQDYARIEKCFGKKESTINIRELI